MAYKIKGDLEVGKKVALRELELKTQTINENNTYGAEMVDGNDWTSTGWSGSFAAGFTHIVGNTTALYRDTFEFQEGYVYRVTFTLANTSAGNVALKLKTIGYDEEAVSQIYGENGSFSCNLKSFFYNALLVEPTSDFNGKITITSVKEVNVRPSAVMITNTLGNTSNELRFLLNGSFFIGTSSGNYSSGTGNVGVGYNSMSYNCEGYGNTALGYSSLSSNTDGFYNTSIGYQSLALNAIGDGNTAIGFNTLYSMTTGSNNTAVGLNAGFNFNGGHNNIFIGIESDSIAENPINTIAIGYQTTTTKDNQVVIGNTDVVETVLRGKIIASTGIFTSTVSNYENYVVLDSDIPNKKFTDDNYVKYTSTGCVTNPTYTDLLNGSITVNQVDIVLYNNTTFTGLSKKYTLSQITVALTNNSVNYIVGDYNSGSPIMRNITDVSLITESNIVPILTIYRNGNNLHVLNWDSMSRGLPNKLHQSIVKTQRYRRESGLGLSEYGTRNVRVELGKIWVGTNLINLSVVNTATDNMYYFQRTGGTWVSNLVTQYNNTQYSDGTNTQTLSNNKYAVNWIYRAIEDSNHVYMVLGGGDYTLLEAQNSQPPSSLPLEMTSHSLLIGRIIVQKGANTAIQINSAFETIFTSGGIINHNDTSNKQGGTVDEYYHLTQAQYTSATREANTLQNGLLSSGDWNLFNNKEPYHGVLARPVGASNPLPTNITTTTFTLGATANPITYYYQGTKVIVNSDKTTTLNDGTAGLYFVYFNGATGNILATKNFPGLDSNSNVIIAFVFWNGADYGLVSDERHSHNRNKAWHYWAHTTIGARYRNGITLTHNGGTGASATFSTTSGEIADEDIQFVVNASSTFPIANSCRIFKQTSSTTYDFDKTASTVPFSRGANNRPNYVRSDTYATVEMNSATNRYINVFVYVTSDLHTPIYMFTETVSPTIAGTNGYNSVAAARAIPFPNLSAMSMSPEMKPIYRLIVRADGQLQAIDTNQDDYRTVSSLPMSAGNTSTTASSVSFNPNSLLLDTTVQNAIDSLTNELLILRNTIESFDPSEMRAGTSDAYTLYTISSFPYIVKKFGNNTTSYIDLRKITQNKTSSQVRFRLRFIITESTTPTENSTSTFNFLGTTLTYTYGAGITQNTMITTDWSTSVDFANTSLLTVDGTYTQKIGVEYLEIEYKKGV